MPKSKTFGKMKLFASNLLPRHSRDALLAWILRTWYKPPTLAFPWNNHAIKKALVILPEDPVEAFHQINNYLQITALYRSASFVLLCTSSVGAFFKHVHPEATIVEYDASQRYLFSQELEERGKSFFKEEFDLCLILEHEPDISLLFLAGKTSAPVRAGYSEAGLFPFLNMHINPSKHARLRADQNAVMARSLGASGERKLQWSVSKETVEEITHMLRELHLTAPSRLIGIDAGLFFREFGADWTEALCARLRENKRFSFYLYAGEEPDEPLSRFLTSTGLPAFSNLSAPRSAALIGKSEGIVSGRSVFFELANMLKKPVIGIFKESERAIYCQESGLTKAVTYSSAPDRHVADSVIALVNSLAVSDRA
jgi:ADP-heptose:LPS heptosyltransferase